MSQPLSPDTQAVLDAFKFSSDTDNCGELNPRLAASLIAAADQVEGLDIPSSYQGESYWPYVHGQLSASEHLRAIASELKKEAGR